MTSAQKWIFDKDLKSVDISYPNLTAQKEIIRQVDQYFSFADTIEVQAKKPKRGWLTSRKVFWRKAFRAAHPLKTIIDKDRAIGIYAH
ncbi:hypothetical protein CW613_002149 [Vibrio mimicus]